VARAASDRRVELLDRSYEYVLAHGLSGLSLRPLAAAVGSSPRVLLFLFGSKDGLIRELLARARAEEVELLERLHGDLVQTGVGVWEWLAAEEHRGLLRLWVESYAQSLVEPQGPWAGFARGTVHDWLDLLARAQPPGERDTAAGELRRTVVLSVLRGALLDLLATGDVARTTRAVRETLDGLRASA
jgi:AcrR family transcriptional regulator